MKNLLLTILFLTSLQAHSGPKSDAEKLFKSKAQYILNLLKNESLKSHSAIEIDLFTLEMNINTSEIKFTRKELKDKYGQVRTALNFPAQRLIKVNLSAWQQISKKDHLVLPLVLHEFLGLSAEEIDSYETSRKILLLHREYAEILAAEELAAQELKEAQIAAELAKQNARGEFINSLELSKFDDRVKWVLAMNDVFDDKAQSAVITVESLVTLYGWDTPLITYFATAKGARKSHNVYLGEHRLRTTWDKDGLLSPARDKICQDLGFDISSDAKHGSRFFPYEHSHRGVNNQLEQIEKGTCRDSQYHQVFKSITCQRI